MKKALVEWTPRTQRGELDGEELVELALALKNLKRRLDAGTGVGADGSHLHLLICDVEQRAAQVAYQELVRRVETRPEAAGPDVEALVERALDRFAGNTAERTHMTNAVVRTLREAGVV